MLNLTSGNLESSSKLNKPHSSGGISADAIWEENRKEGMRKRTNEKNNERKKKDTGTVKI
jgi:hypothetical protein